MTLAVLAVDGVFDTGLAAVRDTFATANELAPLLPQAVPPFECRLVGVRSVVHAANGLRLPLHDLHDATRRLHQGFSLDAAARAAALRGA